MPSGKQSIILVVEDNPDHARLIETNLREARIDNEIVVLSDGKMASDYLFCEGEFSGRLLPASLIIVLDLNLPLIDGYELLARIKSDKSTRRIPVVVLTSSDDERAVARCYDLGCSAFITKPDQAEDFSETVRKFGVFFSMLTSPPL
jgi:CheY-like chemotaxis protein